MTDGIRIEVSPGELIDKITILEIKSARIVDANKRRNVQIELETLVQSRDESVPSSSKLAELTAGLKSVNESLWDVEDRIRLCDRDGSFGPEFVELARSVYRENDKRATLKRRINELLGSRLIEEKDYVDYA